MVFVCMWSQKGLCLVFPKRHSDDTRLLFRAYCDHTRLLVQSVLYTYQAVQRQHRRPHREGHEQISLHHDRNMFCT